MKTRYKIPAFVMLVGLGFFLVFDSYSNTILPIELSTNFLDRILASSEPDSVIADLKEIKEHLPHEGNPVWIYPTVSTDFARIQKDLDIMIVTIEKISTVPKDSSSFHIGMLQVNDRAQELRENIMDAIPYMYVNPQNVFFNSIWIFGTMGIAQFLVRRYG